MPSISEQKANLRELIHKRVERYLAENPDRASEVAMGAIRRLTKKLTLGELSDWHLKVSLIAIADQEED